MLLLEPIPRLKRFSSSSSMSTVWAAAPPFKEAEKRSFKSKIWKPKISSFGIKKPYLLWDLTYFNNVKFTRNFRSCSKNWFKMQDGRFVAMVTKDLQTLNLKFDQVMFNSLVLTWERNFEVTFGIFLVSVFQISVLQSYLDIYLF